MQTPYITSAAQRINQKQKNGDVKFNVSTKDTQFMWIGVGGVSPLPQNRTCGSLAYGLPVNDLPWRGLARSHNSSVD